MPFFGYRATLNTTNQALVQYTATLLYTVYYSLVFCIHPLLFIVCDHCIVCILQSCLSISSESSSDCTSCPLTSEHPLLSQLSSHRHHHQQAAMGTSDGESDHFSTSSSSPVMLESVSPTEQLPPGSASSCGSGGMNSHFPWMPPAVSHNHLSHPFSGMYAITYSCKRAQFIHHLSCPLLALF